MAPDRITAAIEFLAQLTDQSEWAQCTGMPTGASADRNNAVDALRNRLACMPQIDDVMKNEPAVRVHCLHNLPGRTQARDDDRYLFGDADFHICQQTRITRVHNLIDRERRNRLVGVRFRMLGQIALNLSYPLNQGFLRSRVQRRKGTDDARLALRRHKLGPRDDKHRCANQRQPQLAVE